MSSHTLNNIYGYSVLVCVFIWALMVGILIFGLVKKRPRLIKSAIKYLVNSLVFLFFSYVNIWFAMINNPRPEWMRISAQDWLVWAAFYAMLLMVFNVIYHLRVEKQKRLKAAFLITAFDFMIMGYGIFLGYTFAIAY